MSYARRELGGLGASELPWYYFFSAAGACPSGSRGMCVTSDPVDQAWARQQVGGSARCTQVRTGFGGSVSCTTESRNAGTAYCCKQLTSYQEALVEAGQDPYQTGGGVTAATICSAQRVQRSSLANAQQRAVWDIQDRLCQGGQATDPGPVNGLINDRLVEAIRQFQRARGVAVSGRADGATVSALGFSTAEAVAIDLALRGTTIGSEEGGLAVLLPVGVVLGVGTVGLGLLLMWRRKRLKPRKHSKHGKYGKRRSRRR